MVDATAAPALGRGLVRLGRRGDRSAMLEASVSDRRGEAPARWRPAPPAATGPERPRRARPRIQTPAAVASTIYVRVEHEVGAAAHVGHERAHHALGVVAGLLEDTAH